MPEAVLLTVAGFQVPVTALSDVVVRTGTVPPLQMVSELPKLKTGVVLGLTVTFRVAGSAHWPAAGVKV